MSVNGELIDSIEQFDEILDFKFQDSEIPHWHKSSDAVENKIYRQQLRAALKQATSILSKRQRLYIKLHYKREMSLRQIAVFLSVAPSTVESAITEGILKIRVSEHMERLAEFCPWFGFDPANYIKDSSDDEMGFARMYAFLDDADMEDDKEWTP